MFVQFYEKYYIVLLWITQWTIVYNIVTLKRKGFLRVLSRIS